ncbi:tubulin epsilon chain-like [Euwallacea similis]|uniref:tubulin epsilon chain-like n=1 Tax=Euwallacea similis TaxID=1736056 RepID=UPI00345019CF
MSEFIVVQVGQCGNQIGSSLWPKILKEYEVLLNQSKRPQIKTTPVQDSLNSFFHVPNSNHHHAFLDLQELLNNKVKARAICIDMEERVVARYKTGAYRGLFDDKYLVTNFPGSGNNWAEGFCEHGPQYQDKILNCLRHCVEKCDSLHGFLMLFSTGGGTGSGLGTYVLRMLSEFYPKVERFVSSVYATGTEDVITSPYNNALATQQLLENATCVFPVENRCLLDIALKKLKTSAKYEGQFHPTDGMNSSVVDMLLHLTSGSRFPGNLNFDMNEINTNMVPFPKINFLTSGFNHILTCNENAVSNRLKEELFLASCHRANQLIKVDPLSPSSLLLASTLMGRGDYTISDLQRHVTKLQAKAKFTPWSQKAIKFGLCNVPPNGEKATLFSLFNTTGMGDLFRRIHSQYCSLYKKQAHIHHYCKVQNFDLNFFEECKESLESAVEKYRELENIKPMNVPRLKPF